MFRNNVKLQRTNLKTKIKSIEEARQTEKINPKRPVTDDSHIMNHPIIEHPFISIVRFNRSMSHRSKGATHCWYRPRETMTHSHYSTFCMRIVLES